LVASFRALPDIGVYSPQLNVLVPSIPVGDVSPLEFIQLTGRYLPRHTPDRLMLLTWARTKAGIGEPVAKIPP
jgi:hypothetical protein